MLEKGFDRRSFLRLGTVGGIGLCLLPMSEAEAYSWATLLASLGSFARSVSSSVITNQIQDYIASIRNPDHKAQVISENQHLAENGFNDFSHSIVRENTFGEENRHERIYYPLVYSGCDCLHFSSPFFNMECGCTPITNIEGTHMTGLALAAQEMSDPKSVLFPKTGIQEATGDRFNGYSRPLMYKSNVATVAVQYKPKSDNRGSVIVEAESTTTGELLHGRRYEVRFA